MDHPSILVPVSVAEAPIAGAIPRPLGISRVLGVFDGIDDWLNVGFAFLFFALAALELGLGWFPFGETQREFIAEIIFLNTTHVALTFVLLAGTPELRTWIDRKTGGQTSRFWLPVIGAGLLIFLGFAGADLYFLGDTRAQSALSAVMLIIGVTIPEFHGLWQAKGISLAYNQRIRQTYTLTDVEKKAALACEKREKWAFVLFYWCEIFLNFSFFFEFDKVGITVSEPLLAQCKWISSVLTGAVAAFIWLNSRSFPYAKRSFKTLFLTRIFLLPLMGISKAALFGAVACHGIEYLFVYRGIKRHAKLTPQEGRSLNRNAVLSWVAITALTMPWWVVVEEDRTTWMILSVSLVMGIIYAHYYTDRILFRMRDPETRDIVGKLLLG